ncbi:MAG: cysteine hydrolase family protein [Thermoplasmatales archaeon]
MVKITRESALVVIDVQEAWSDPALGNRNNPNAEKVISYLIANFRVKGGKLVHVRHHSRNPNSPFIPGKKSFEFKEEAKPLEGEIVITKRVNSAFIGTDLEKILREKESDKIFYVGLTTDHCVSTTARMSGNMGFESYVIEDACATFDRYGISGEIIPAEEVHRVNLASINGEFANVISSSQLEF